MNGKQSAYRNYFPASLSKYWSLETLHAEDAAHSLHPFDLRGLYLIPTYKLIEGNCYHSQLMKVANSRKETLLSTNSLNYITSLNQYGSDIHPQVLEGFCCLQCHCVLYSFAT